MNVIPEKQDFVFERFIKVIDNYKSVNRSTVLDIGCANGVFMDIIGKYGATCYGIDFNAEAVQGYKQKHPEGHVEVYDINNVAGCFPFENVQFDVITCFDVIEHLSNFEKLKLIIAHHLKSDGVFVVTTPNANALEKIVNKSYSGEYDTSHTMLFTPYTLDFFLRRMGLKKKMLYTPYVFMFYPNIFNRTIAKGGQLLGIYGK